MCCVDVSTACFPRWLKKGEGSPQKKRKKEEEKKEVWKWWEEERLPDGVKWRTLEHNVSGGGEERLKCA